MPDNAKIDILFFIYCAIDYIDQVLTSGGSILVHCIRGFSRAPTIICAYLMWKEAISSHLAWEIMQQFNIDPNFGFLCQLKFFQTGEEGCSRTYEYDTDHQMFMQKKATGQHSAILVSEGSFMVVQVEGIEDQERDVTERCIAML